MRTHVVVAAGLLGLVQAQQAAAQPQLSWSRFRRPNPIARLEAPMVWDSTSQRMVIFGGYDHLYNRDAETWEYAGATRTWREVTPTGLNPPRRSAHTLAFDPVRGRILLFGGITDDNVLLADTWEWDCAAKTWTDVTPATSPTPRRGARMYYSAARDRIVLFGGGDYNQFYADTWEWNPITRTWAPFATTASSGAGRTFVGKAYHALSYNPVTGRVVMFGGIGFAQGGSTVLDYDELWELRGTVWTDVTPSTRPPAGGWRPLVFDPAANRLVTYGGWNNTAGFSYNDTWATTWNGNAWTNWQQIAGAAASPGVRDSHAMEYDPLRGKIVLFGGFLADMWELTGNTWAVLPGFNPSISDYTPWPPAEDWHSLTYDPNRSEVVLYAAGAPEVFELGPGLRWDQWYVTGPDFRVKHALAFDTPRDRAVLFGGRCIYVGAFTGTFGPCGPTGTVYGDTWSWNPTARTWTNLAPSPSPAARYDHAMVYDPLRSRIVLFGGRSAAGAALGDTWTWNGATGSWQSGPAGPPARFGHSLAWDPGRGVVVLFGGEDGAQRFRDVWEWNGSAWTNRGTPAGPTARAYAASSAISASGTGVLVFGGRDATGLLNDAWIWDGAQWTAAVQPGRPPSPREYAKAVYSTSLNRVVLTGGVDATGVAAGDVWLGTTRVKGDMDSNGTTDLLLRNTSNWQTFIWAMNGTSLSFSYGLSANPSAAEEIAGIDDFDLDGRNDLAVFNPATGLVTFWRMDGPTLLGTTPLSGAPGPMPAPWSLVATADFNGDSKPDLLWRNNSTQKIVVWTLNGTAWKGSIVPVPDQAVDANWRVVGALDYNADGDTDLLWYNPYSGKIVFWFMDRFVARITGQFANPPNAGDNNWQVLAAGDYGVGAGGTAGTKDLVWRNATSGKYVVWFMDTAGNRTSGVFTSPDSPAPDPTSWTIAGPR